MFNPKFCRKVLLIALLGAVIITSPAYSQDQGSSAEEKKAYVLSLVQFLKELPAHRVEEFLNEHAKDTSPELLTRIRAESQPLTEAVREKFDALYNAIASGRTSADGITDEEDELLVAATVDALNRFSDWFNRLEERVKKERVNNN